MLAAQEMAHAAGRSSLAGFYTQYLYMLTDLFHLRDNRVVPPWYELLLIISFSWTALLMGIISVPQMEKKMDSLFSSCWKGGGLYIVMLLNAMGIFIGGS